MTFRTCCYKITGEQMGLLPLLFFLLLVGSSAVVFCTLISFCSIRIPQRGNVSGVQGG